MQKIRKMSRSHSWTDDTERTDVYRGAYQHEIERGSLLRSNRIRPAEAMSQAERRDADCAERDHKPPKLGVVDAVREAAQAIRKPAANRRVQRMAAS